MYIPLAISFKKKNLVALPNALSLLSSQVFGWGNLNPFGQMDCTDAPVVKYSLATGLRALEVLFKYLIDCLNMVV